MAKIGRPAPGTVMGFIALVISLSGVAIAAVPGGDGTIKLCYSPIDPSAGVPGGDVRVIDATTADCTHNTSVTPSLASDILLTINAAGPSGAAGPQGTQGVAGPQGPSIGSLGSGEASQVVDQAAVESGAISAIRTGPLAPGGTSPSHGKPIGPVQLPHTKRPAIVPDTGLARVSATTSNSGNIYCYDKSPPSGPDVYFDASGNPFTECVKVTKISCPGVPIPPIAPTWDLVRGDPWIFAYTTIGSWGQQHLDFLHTYDTGKRKEVYFILYNHGSIPEGGNFLKKASNAFFPFLPDPHDSNAYVHTAFTSNPPAGNDLQRLSAFDFRLSGYCPTHPK